MKFAGDYLIPSATGIHICLVAGCHTNTFLSVFYIEAHALRRWIWLVGSSNVVVHRWRCLQGKC
jgi:hypothetical protein